MYLVLNVVNSPNHLWLNCFSLPNMNKFILQFFFGSKEFLPNTSFKRFVGSKLCPLKIIDKICRDILFMITGYDLNNLNKVRTSCI